MNPDRRFESLVETVARLGRSFEDLKSTILIRLRGDVDGLGIWQSWIPTTANLNVGSTGSVSAVYARVGNVVFFDIHVTLGGTGISVGDVTFTVPVAEDPGYSSGADDRVRIGDATFIDAATATYDGVTTIDDGVLRPRFITAATGAQVSLSSTVPFTWVATDRMYLHGWYRAV